MLMMMKKKMMIMLMTMMIRVRIGRCGMGGQGGSAAGEEARKGGGEDGSVSAMAVANADDHRGRRRRGRSVSARAATNADDPSRPDGSGTAKAETGALRGVLGSHVKPSEGTAHERPVESTFMRCAMGYKTKSPVESKHVSKARRGA